MELYKLAIHQIQKEQHKPTSDAKIDLSDELTPIGDDEKNQFLATKLDKVFNRDTTSVSRFKESSMEDPENAEIFPNGFITMFNLSSGIDDEQFLMFSRNATIELYDILTHYTSASGGYVVYCHYKNELSTYVSVFIIRNTNGLLLNKDENSRSYKVDDVIHLELDKLAMACKIDCNKFSKCSLDNSIRYLTFINTRKTENSKYFLRWISSDDTIKKEVDATSFLNIIQSMDPPINPNTKKPYQRSEFQYMVDQYIRHRPNKLVNLMEFSKHFFDDPNFIRNYAQKHNIDISTEFNYHKILGKFTKVEVIADNMKFHCPRGTLEDNVEAHSDPNKIIITSAEFSKLMRVELDKS